MREWLVIEDSRKKSIFGPQNSVLGYIPRDIVENDLKIKCRNGYMWFTKEQSNAMRTHPEWKTDLPTPQDGDGK